MTVADNIVLASIVLGIVGAALWYQRRIRIPRPPIGLITWGDMLAVSVGLILLPFAYLHIPAAVTSALFGLMTFGLVQATFAPMLTGTIAALLAASLCAGDIALWWAGQSTALMVADTVLMGIVVIGMTNLWVQAGMKPHHVAGLAAVLTVYDTLATAASPVTPLFVRRVAALPFAPLVGVRMGDPPVWYGLGDCIMLTVWPLVAGRIYGRTAGCTAVGVDALVMFAVQSGQYLGLVHGPVPLQTVFGPIVLLQFIIHRRRCGQGSHSYRSATSIHTPADRAATPGDAAGRG